MQLHRGCLQNTNSQEPNHDSPNQQGEASSSLTLCVMWKDEGQSLSGSRGHQFKPGTARPACCPLCPTSRQSPALWGHRSLLWLKLIGFLCQNHFKFLAEHIWGQRLLCWSFSPRTNPSHMTNCSPAPCVPKGWTPMWLCPCCWCGQVPLTVLAGVISRAPRVG